MAAQWTLNGKVVIEGGEAIKVSEAIADRLMRVNANARATSEAIKNMAAAYELSTRAVKNETKALGDYGLAQAKADAIRRKSLADMRLTNAKTGDVVSNAENKKAIAQGQERLLQNKALGETVKQNIALDDAEGRAAVRNAQMASMATKDRLAQEKFLWQQQESALRAQERAARTAQASVGRTEAGLTKLGEVSTRVGIVTGAIFVGLAANAINMESHFARVIRTSDILDLGASKGKSAMQNQAEAAKALRLQFDELAQHLPLTYKSLTEIGTAANQLGVAHENLAAFTDITAKFSATTGVTVDATATALGRLDSLIPDVRHQYEGLADSINKVGVKSVATDQQIIAIASGIAGIAASAGLGYKAIIGFSGALASASIQPYLARGLTTRLFTNLNNAVADGGSKLARFAEVSGISADKFKAAWGGTDQGAKEHVLIGLLKGIHAAGPDAVNVLKDLGEKSVLDQSALVKLAGAADSTGAVGKLLTQTFRDANTAAGENAKQYEVIANTVQARLQVALNRVQILLRNIGDTNMGPLGAAIDGIGTSALRLSQGLEKPFKLLGAFQLPFSNGELLAFGSLALGAVAGLTLLVGISAKVVASFMKVGDGVRAVRDFLGRGRTATDEYAASTTRAAGANDVLAASLTRVAEASVLSAFTADRIGAPMVAPTKVIPSSNRVFAASAVGAVNETVAAPLRIANGEASQLQRGLFRVSQAYDGLSHSSNGFLRFVGGIGPAGSSAFGKVREGAMKLGSTVKAVGGGIVDTLMGPVGLAVGALTVGFMAAGAAMQNIGTKAGDAAVLITKAKNAAELLKGVRVSAAVDPIAALWDQSTKPFMTNVNQFRAGARNLGTGGVLPDFAAHMADNGRAFMGDTSTPTFNATTAGLDKLDAGFKALADSGNTKAAVANIQKFLKPLTDAERTNVLAHMGSATEILTSALNAQGVAAGKDDVNLLKLTHSNKVLTENMTQAQKAAIAQSDAMAKLSGDGLDYLKVTEKESAAALDLATSWKNATPKKGSTPSLNEFFKQAETDLGTFQKKTENIAILNGKFGPGYAKALSSLPPDLLSAVIAAGPKVEKRLQNMMDRGLNADAYVANMAKIMDNTKLNQLYGSLTKKQQDKVAEELKAGHSIEDAWKSLGQRSIDAYNRALGTHLDKNIRTSLDNVSLDKARSINANVGGKNAPEIRAGEGVPEIMSTLRGEIKVSADTMVAHRQGEKAADYISRLRVMMKILGDNNPVIEKGKSAAYIIGEEVARVKMDADPSKFKRTAEQQVAEANKLKTQLNIEGDAKHAKATGLGAAADISKFVARLVIDADKKLALSKGRDTSVEISKLQGIMKILGDPIPAKGSGESAKAYIDRLKGMIAIFANGSQAITVANYTRDQINRMRASITITANTGNGAAFSDARNSAAAGGHATGGPITGAGTGTSDSIPTMLSNGEYVIRAAQVAKNRKLLDAINYGTHGYATGGVVTKDAQYNDSLTALTSATVRAQQAANSNTSQVTALDPYDRHLLQTIADNIGVTIAPSYLANVNATVNRVQARRGNG